MQFQTRNNRGFTMVEIALAIGILGIALVAIVGVLPLGLNVQKENREDTIIEQEGDFFLDILTNNRDFGRGRNTVATGQRGLTNRVDMIRVQIRDLVSNSIASDLIYSRAQTTGLVSNWAPRTIIDLLTRPYWTVDTWHTLRVDTKAVVRAGVGSAVEQTPAFQDFGFRYELTSKIHPFSSPTEFGGDPELTEILETLGERGSEELSRQRNLLNNLYEVTLELRWPVTDVNLDTGTYNVGSNLRTFRGLLGGSILQDTRSPVMYFATRGLYTPNPQDPMQP